MKTKRKLLFSFMGLILSLAVFSTVVFAWFANSDVTSDFIVETGNLKTETKFYKAVLSDGNYSLTEVTTSDAVSKTFENIKPGQVVTFVLKVKNTSESTLPVNCTITFGDIKINGAAFTGEEADPHLAKAIHVTTAPITVADGATSIASSIIQGVTVADASFNPQSSTTLVTLKGNPTVVTNDELAIGEFQYYAIRFYFNPLYEHASTDGIVNSNELMKQKFTVANITVSYTQKQELVQ